VRVFLRSCVHNRVMYLRCILAICFIYIFLSICLSGRIIRVFECFMYHNCTGLSTPDGQRPLSLIRLVRTGLPPVVSHWCLTWPHFCECTWYFILDKATATEIDIDTGTCTATDTFGRRHGRQGLQRAHRFRGIHTCIYTCIHTYIIHANTYIHTNIHTCMHVLSQICHA